MDSNLCSTIYQDSDGKTFLFYHKCQRAGSVAAGVSGWNLVCSHKASLHQKGDAGTAVGNLGSVDEDS